MNFGNALESLKQGNKVCRSGWNDKGMWLIFVESFEYTIVSQCNVMDSKLLPWIAMKTADNGFVPWLASQTDILAEDWMIVD